MNLFFQILISRSSFELKAILLISSVKSLYLSLLNCCFIFSIKLLCLYWDRNDLYRWVMSQKSPVNDFQQVKNIFELKEDFIKIYSDESDEEYFHKVDV